MAVFSIYTIIVALIVLTFLMLMVFTIWIVFFAIPRKPKPLKPSLDTLKVIPKISTTDTTKLPIISKISLQPSPKTLPIISKIDSEPENKIDLEPENKIDLSSAVIQISPILQETIKQKQAEIKEQNPPESPPFLFGHHVTPNYIPPQRDLDEENEQTDEEQDLETDEEILPLNKKKRKKTRKRTYSEYIAQTAPTAEYTSLIDPNQVLIGGPYIPFKKTKTKRR